MPLREGRLSRHDPCSLAKRWVLDVRLAQDLFVLDQFAAKQFSARGIRFERLTVISGRRSPKTQIIVNPNAPNSLHTYCPSLAVDLRVGSAPASKTSPAIWFQLGQWWEMMGHRWGGRFRPPDLNHFDMAVPFTGADRAA